MQFKLKAISAIAPNINLSAANDADQAMINWALNPTFDETQTDVPKLDFIPMMQRRRLSKFAKLCCYSLNQLGLEQHHQMVFVSRFGDLQKTNALIEEAAKGEDLSPAQFGLSVHNAVAGQFSIFTGNQQPSTTISAGEDSFHQGLIDAYARLHQSNDDEIVMVCTEGVPPEKYRPYITEQLIEHSVAVVLSKSQGTDIELSFDINAQPMPTKQPLPQALAFLAWWCNNDKSATSVITSATKRWHWQYV